MVITRYMQISYYCRKIPDIFISPNRGYTVGATVKPLIQFIFDYEIDIKENQGQSYVNVANMNRKYTGM